MHRSITFLFSILLESLMITPFALTIPSLSSLIQTNYTVAPLLSINGHDLPLDYTPLPPPVCHFITNPPLTGLSAAKCGFLSGGLCSNLALRGPEARNRWIWSETSGCALGYYLPDNAAVPSEFECDHLVFEEIRDQCATDWRYNAGSINVNEYPDFSGDGTAVDPEKARYVMAPGRLTL